jgi:hypothetical protein
MRAEKMLAVASCPTHETNPLLRIPLTSSRLMGSTLISLGSETIESEKAFDT